MKEQYMDIPVNIRQRLDDVNGDEYCGFYVTEVTFKCDVTLETKLWDLARNIQGQLKTIIGQDQHLLFAKVINPKKPRGGGFNLFFTDMAGISSIFIRTSKIVFFW